MNKTIMAALIFFFLLATAVPVISKDYNPNTHGRRDYKERPNHPSRPDYKKGPDNPRRPDYKKGPKYRNHRGYRERPYDHSRHYGHYDYRGHRYNYHGHWRSWEQFDNYARKHPNLYRHGKYYRENSHLMFRFCDPGTGSCFFFSIGR